MRIGLALALAAIAGEAQAQEVDFERLRTLPFEEALAAYNAQDGGEDISLGLLRWVARRALSDLLYPIDLRTPFEPLTDADTVASIRAFEEKIGVEPDGILTWDEFEQLGRFGFLSRVTPLSPGAGKHVGSYDGPAAAVFASGSWSMEDIAWPLNRAEIVCSISREICEETTTSVWAPAQSGSQRNTSSYGFNTSTSSYDIVSWRNGILEAVTESSCRQVRLSINTNTELVTQTTQDLTAQGCEIPGTSVRLDPIRQMRVATLIDSLDAQAAYEQARHDTIKRVQGPLAATLDQVR